MASTSTLVYYYTWTTTPPGMAGISTKGPSNVPFGCKPDSPAQYVTFEWEVLGNGCPGGYSYNVASTCFYTADVTNSMTWGCTWTPSTILTSTVFGGTKTFAAGAAATVTAPIQWITVTRTQQTTTTTTSIVDPGARTVTVASTQSPRRRRSQYPMYKAQPGNPPLLEVLDEVNSSNATHPLHRRACQYSNEFYCGIDCCYNGQSCIGGGVWCCQGFGCVHFDATAPFTSYLFWSASFFTLTSTTWSTTTTYSTMNQPSLTTTVTPTSTTQVTITQTQTAQTVITATDPIITVFDIIQTGTAAISTISISPSNSPIASPVPDNNGVKIGVGVGVSLGIALIAALLFIFLRRRKQQESNPTSQLPEAGYAQPISSRPMSELPPYTYSTLVGAGIARKPVLKQEASPVVEPLETPHGQQEHGLQGGQGHEMDTQGNRHEMPSPIHQLHELPAHYGP